MIEAKRGESQMQIDIRCQSTYSDLLKLEAALVINFDENFWTFSNAIESLIYFIFVFTVVEHLSQYAY